MKPDAPQAANTNLPLWKRAAYRMIETRYAADLGEAERAALLARAVEIMKPTEGEQAELAADREKQDAFLLLFTRAYASGIPPYSRVSDRSVAGYTE